MILREEKNVYRRETCLSATLCTRGPTSTGLALTLNLRRRGRWRTAWTTARRTLTIRFRNAHLSVYSEVRTEFLNIIQNNIMFQTVFLLVVKGPAADATDAPQPWGLLCNPMMKVTMKMIIFCPFPSNGAPMKWNWHGETEELGEKPVPAPLCPPQIRHGLTRDRNRASAVGGRRLTAWAMARPFQRVNTSLEVRRRTIAWGQ
jgi:hypothetical protein